MSETAPNSENFEDTNSLEHSDLSDKELDVLFRQQVYANISESIRQRNDYIALDEALKTETAQNLIDAGEYKLLADAVVSVLSERVRGYVNDKKRDIYYQFSEDSESMHSFLAKANKINISFAIEATKVFIEKVILQIPTTVGNYSSWLYQGVHPDLRFHREDGKVAKELMHATLRLPEIKNQVDQKIASNLQIGNFSIAKDFGYSKEFDLDNIWENPTIIKAAREGILNTLRDDSYGSGDFNDLLVLEQVYPNGFGQDERELEEAARQGILTRIKNGLEPRVEGSGGPKPKLPNLPSDLWKQYVYHNKKDLFSLEKLRNAVPAGVIKALEKGHLYKVNTFIAMLPQQESSELEMAPETTEAAKIGIINLLKERDFDVARTIAERFLDKSDSFFPAELRRAVPIGVHWAIHEGLSKWAKQIANLLPSQEANELIASSETKETVKTSVVHLLNIGSLDTARETAEQFIEKNDMLNAASEAVVQSLEAGVFDRAREIANFFSPQERIVLRSSSEVIRAAGRSVVISLMRGNVQQAAELTETFLLENSKELSEAWILGLTDFTIDDQRLTQLIKNAPIIPISALRQVGLTELQPYIVDLGYQSAQLFRDYQTLKKSKNTMLLEGFIHNVKNLTEVIVSSKSTPKSTVENEYYAPIIKALFPNNISGYASYESNESCTDRTRDIEKYTFQDKYRINLGEGVALKLRAGMTENQELTQELESSLIELGEEASVDEEAIFVLALESMAGRKGVAEVRQSLLRLENSRLPEGLEQYLNNLKAQSSEAKKPRAAYLQALREFYSDQMKEMAREVAEAGLSNITLASSLPKYFSEVSSFRFETEQRTKLASLQLGKVGITDPFLTQLISTLEKTGGKNKAFSLYERDDSGNLKLDEQGDPVLGSKGKALASMIKSQSGGIENLIQVVTGDRPASNDIHIGRFSIDQLLQSEKQLSGGEYDPVLFQAYIESSLQGMFQTEIDRIDDELRKYEPASTAGDGRRAKQLDVFFSKNKVSAHARATGGVCVSGDNPSRGEKNMWDMPNYFQLVLQDPESKQCQGLVLLHEVNDNGKKILSASYNPSSTYLYTIDESQLFNRLTDVLSNFSRENQFDVLAVSKNKEIRTNRRKTTFAETMDQRIADVDIQLPLSGSHDFSYYPSNYKLEGNLDVIWQRESNDQLATPFVSTEEADTLQ